MKTSALLLSFAIITPALAAEDREWVSYTKFVETMRLDKYNAIPAAERDKVQLFTSISPNNKAIKPSDIVLTIVHGSGRQTVTVKPDGRIDFPYNPKWVTDNANILINQPKGEKMSMSFGMNAALPPGTQWHYAPLMSSIDQGNKVIKKVAGMMSMFAPKAEALELVFANPAQVKIGTKTLSTDAKHRIKLVPDEALIKENPVVVVSERPLHAELD